MMQLSHKATEAPNKVGRQFERTRAYKNILHRHQQPLQMDITVVLRATFHMYVSPFSLSPSRQITITCQHLKLPWSLNNVSTYLCEILFLMAATLASAAVERSVPLPPLPVLRRRHRPCYLCFPADTPDNADLPLTPPNVGIPAAAPPVPRAISSRGQSLVV